MKQAVADLPTLVPWCCIDKLRLRSVVLGAYLRASSKVHVPYRSLLSLALPNPSVNAVHHSRP